MRRAIIAASTALALGGSLVLAASASAIPVPIGSPNDQAYSGTGIPTSVYSLLNASYLGLEGADYVLNAVGDTAVPCTPSGSPPVCTGFPTESAITSTQAQQIAADFTGQTINGTAPDVHSPAWSTLAAGADANYATDAPEVGSAGGSWSELSQLVGFLGSASGILNSSDSATVSSSGTVSAITTSTTTASPIAYDVKLSAPAGGYILPSAFSLTFPAGLAVNTALVSDEVNATNNTAAVELNPSGTAIGTVTLTSPLADEFGGVNNQLVGKIYVVQTGQSSGQGSVTQPYLELWFPAGGNPIYDLGQFPGSLAFPLTLDFPHEAYISVLSTNEPLPLNSLELSFPPATSPVKSLSCTSLGTAGGTATDAIAGLAFEFGDMNDGVSSATGTPSAVTLAATPTAVTDDCATIATVKNTATGSASGLTNGHPTFTFKIKTNTAFGSVTIGAPGGLKFVKSKSLAKEVSASGAKIKSVKIAGGKLVISLKSKVKSVTIKTKKGAVSESNALIKSIKKHKTKKLVFRIKAGSVSLKDTIKA